MARVQYGGGVVQFRGSIAGNTFHRNAAGNICRQRISPYSPYSSLRSDIQSISYYLLTVWRSLPLDAQINWNDFASAHQRTDKFNDTKSLTGYNYFSSINFNRLLLSLSILYNPPSYTLPDPITSFSISADASDIVVEFSPASIPSNTSLFVFTTPPLSTPTLSIRSTARLTSILPPATNTLHSILSDWMSTHNLPHPLSNPRHYYISSYAYTVSHTTGLIQPALFASCNVD